MRDPSQPMSAYSGNKAWGQGWVDNANVISSLALIPSTSCGGLTGAGGILLPSSPKWVAWESAVLWQLLGLPELPRIPHPFVWGHGFALEEKLQWRTSAGWESLSFFWSSPNISPNPSLSTQREDSKGLDKPSAWLLFCPFCEIQKTCHTHTQIKELPMQKRYFLHHGSLPTAGLIHRKPGCGLTKAHVGARSLANGTPWTGW